MVLACIIASRGGWTRVIICVIKSCDILLLSQQFLHALIAINPCEGRRADQGEKALWKEDNPSASFRHASGDNVATHAVPSASEKANT